MDQYFKVMSTTASERKAFTRGGITFSREAWTLLRVTDDPAKEDKARNIVSRETFKVIAREAQAGGMLVMQEAPGVDAEDFEESLQSTATGPGDARTLALESEVRELKGMIAQMIATFGPEFQKVMQATATKQPRDPAAEAAPELAFGGNTPPRGKTPKEVTDGVPRVEQPTGTQPVDPRAADNSRAEPPAVEVKSDAELRRGDETRAASPPPAANEPANRGRGR